MPLHVPEREASDDDERMLFGREDTLDEDAGRKTSLSSMRVLP
jgi:hypothetical protein